MLVSQCLQTSISPVGNPNSIDTGKDRGLDSNPSVGPSSSPWKLLNSGVSESRPFPDLGLRPSRLIPGIGVGGTSPCRGFDLRALRPDLGSGVHWVPPVLLDHWRLPLVPETLVSGSRTHSISEGPGSFSVTRHPLRLLGPTGSFDRNTRSTFTSSVQDRTSLLRRVCFPSGGTSGLSSEGRDPSLVPDRCLGSSGSSRVTPPDTRPAGPTLFPCHSSRHPTCRSYCSPVSLLPTPDLQVLL